MFTYTCDPVCPHCGADLRQQESVTLFDSECLVAAQVGEYDVIVEEPGTQLILEYPDEVFVCRNCGWELDAIPNVE